MLKEIIATIATVLIGISYLPQIIKGYRRKSLRDVSMAFLVIISFGLFSWILYGFVNMDNVFIIANIINLSFALTLVFMKLHYDA